MADTKIEWTDVVWNPTRGCSRVSPGCGGGTPGGGGGCYAERMAIRQAKPGQAYHGLVRSGLEGPRWTGVVRLAEDTLTAPLRWRKPRRVFVNSMSDLFHESLTDEQIDRVFGVMHACEFIGRDAHPGHTFQILTKRADRMRAYLSADRREKWARAGASACEGGDQMFDQIAFRKTAHPRIWVGVSVENQHYANQRVVDLLATPAAVRFLSCEPLLGSIDLAPWLLAVAQCGGCGQMTTDRRAITGCKGYCQDPTGQRCGALPCPVCQRVHWWTGSVPRLGWVIVGGESGPGARPFHLSWADQIVQQCAAAHVPCFVKQMGARPVARYYDEEAREMYELRTRQEWPMPADMVLGTQPPVAATVELALGGKGGEMDLWPQRLRVRQFPSVKAP